MFGENYEAFDMDYCEQQELLELSVKDTVEREQRESAQDDLEQLADELDLTFGDSEEELITALRDTAQDNPLSETAVDLRIEALSIL